MKNLIFTLLFVILVIPLQADEKTSSLLGSTEAEAQKVFGQPEARMEIGEELVLIYREAAIHFSKGRIDSIKPRNLAAEKALRIEQDRQAEVRKQREAEERAAAERERQEHERELLATLPRRIEELERTRKTLEQEKQALQQQVLLLQGTIQQLQYTYASPFNYSPAYCPPVPKCSTNSVHVAHHRH
jgi:hypothetical protein